MQIIFSAFFNDVLTLQNMLLMFVAMVVGMVAGALPGFSATMAVALLVPFTFTMNPTSGLVTIGALYASAIFGGCFSAILLNTPGTPSSIGTCFDGFPMTKNGRGEEALYTASFASGIGGVLGTVILIAFAVPLARWSLRFGPPEFFWTAVFGLTIISSLSTKSVIKGFTAGFIGIILGMIGLSPIGGDARFDFGISDLQGGVEMVSVLIGFFCIPEMLRLASNPSQRFIKVDKLDASIKALVAGFRNVFCHWGNIIRSSVIGALVGILPGAGGNIANLIAYNEAKRAAKDPETFGTGNPQGVVATETSNNAVVESAMIPLLALGIPGSPPAAIIYGALLLQGLNPGPELFEKGGNIVYAFMTSFFVVNVIMVIVGILAGKYIFKLVINVPTRVLVPSILLLTVVGSYAIRNNIMDVILMLLSGVAGYFLSELDFDSSALVLGLILGPIAEKGFVQGIIIGNQVSADFPWIVFFTRPICQVLILLCLVSACWPLVRHFLLKRKRSLTGGVS